MRFEAPEHETVRPMPPGLSVISNVPTPYRVHLHRRLVAEIPEMTLYSFFTHGRADFNWPHEGIETINPIFLSVGSESIYRAGHPSRWASEYRRAGRIIDHAGSHDVRALLLNGYNDVTRLRLAGWGRRNGVATFLRGDSNIRSDRSRRFVRALIQRRLVGWIIGACDGVMPMGRLGEAYFKKYGATPQSCFLVPYEPDYALFESADDGDIAAFAAERGLDRDRRYLLSCGRQVAVKRVDLVLDAFARIAAERPEWDLLVAGDGPLAGELRRRVPSELVTRVHWLGFLPVEEMRLAYHLGDVLVLPSDYEPWGLVVNEAMAAGCPVVASDVVGAADELVRDGVGGRTFRAGDLDDLTDAIERLTTPETLDEARRGAASALAAWRRRADPVAGIRRALASVGVLEG